MRIIKRKSDNVVLFAGDDLMLSDKKCEGKGWLYTNFEPGSLVIEDVDSVPDNLMPGKTVYEGDKFTSPIDAEDLTMARKMAIRFIDDHSDSLVESVIGRRDVEYLTAETEALMFIEADYKGDVPTYVQAWADATDNSPNWAADSIANTASKWRTSSVDLRAHRLRAKEDVRNAETRQDINSITESFEMYLDQLRRDLGV